VTKFKAPPVGAVLVTQDPATGEYLEVIKDGKIEAVMTAGGIELKADQSGALLVNVTNDELITRVSSPVTVERVNSPIPRGTRVIATVSGAYTDGSILVEAFTASYDVSIIELFVLRQDVLNFQPVVNKILPDGTLRSSMLSPQAANPYKWEFILLKGESVYLSLYVDGTKATQTAIEQLVVLERSYE